jgi:hypothetical protein
MLYEFPKLEQKLEVLFVVTDIGLSLKASFGF